MYCSNRGLKLVPTVGSALIYSLYCSNHFLKIVPTVGSAVIYTALTAFLKLYQQKYQLFYIYDLLDKLITIPGICSCVLYTLGANFFTIHFDVSVKGKVNCRRILIETLDFSLKAQHSKKFYHVLSRPISRNAIQELFI
jgi:hypothetical protein